MPQPVTLKKLKLNGSMTLLLSDKVETVIFFLINMNF